MATWVVGDVHGCWFTFERLLERIGWSAERDTLWCVGDLVARGTGSLEVLRWVHRHRDRVRVVLGNHDLHLVARSAGLTRARAGDRLDHVLRADDSARLLDWLRHRPLVHHERGWLTVHAGLLPEWDLQTVLALARAAEVELAAPRWDERLRAARGALKRLRKAIPETTALAAAMVFTRLRTVDAAGRPRTGFTGSLDEIPEGCGPWFEASPVPGPDTTVVFGHWANLGLYRGEHVICLDSGCVYGGNLSVLRVDDGVVISQPLANRDRLPNGAAPGLEVAPLDDDVTAVPYMGGS